MLPIVLDVGLSGCDIVLMATKKTALVQVRLTPEEYEHWKEMADGDARTVSGFVRKAVTQYLELMEKGGLVGIDRGGADTKAEQEKLEKIRKAEQLLKEAMGES